MMKFQKCRWSDDHRSPLNTTWVEKQRPEAEQKPIQCRKIGRASPRTMNNQELLLHEQTIGDNRPRPAGPQELGDPG